MCYNFTMTCKQPNCVNPVHVRKVGLCKAHYQLWYRNKPLRDVPQLEHVPCAVSGCPRFQDVGRLCASHRSVAWRMSVNEDELIPMLNDGRCQICGLAPSRGSLQIDHDHTCCNGNYSCGKCIRGLLCAPHNMMVARVEAGVVHDVGVAAYLSAAPHVTVAPWVPKGADKTHPGRNKRLD